MLSNEVSSLKRTSTAAAYLVNELGNIVHWQPGSQYKRASSHWLAGEGQTLLVKEDVEAVLGGVSLEVVVGDDFGGHCEGRRGEEDVVEA